MSSDSRYCIDRDWARRAYMKVAKRRHCVQILDATTGSALDSSASKQDAEAWGAYLRGLPDPTPRLSAFLEFSDARLTTRHILDYLPAETEIIARTLRRLSQADLPSRSAPLRDYENALTGMSELAEQKYDSCEIGSWAAGALRAYAGLGKSISWHSEPKQREWELIHLRSRLQTAVWEAQIPAETNVNTLVGGLLRSMVHDGMASEVQQFLHRETTAHALAVAHAQESPTLHAWIDRLCHLSMLTDTQFIVYWCITRLVGQRKISTSALNCTPGLTLQHCREEENRLDEMAAYTVANGVGEFVDDPLHHRHYMARIVELSDEQGARVAKRQARFDVARLVIPRFLMEDACNAVDASRASETEV